MAAYTKYYLVEREVYTLLNAFQGDTIANLTTRLTANTYTDDVDLTNPLFNRFSTRTAILDAQEIIASQICRTEGATRRVDFLNVIQVGHMDTLPSTVAGIGASYDATGIPMTSVDTYRIWDMLEAQAGPLVANTQRDLYFAIDGSRFYTTLPANEKARLEIYDYTVSLGNFAAIDTLFSVTSPVDSLLRPEFRPAWVYLAGGLLASKIGTYREEAAGYLQMAQQMLAQQEIVYKMVVDFKGDASA